MTKYYSSTATFSSVKRMNSSANGNPRYRIFAYIDNYADGGKTVAINAVTKSDSSWCYAINGQYTSNHPDGSYPINICYHITQAGRCIIDSIPHDIAITYKFMNRIEE